MPGGTKVLDQRSFMFGADDAADPDACTFDAEGADKTISVGQKVMLRISVANDGTAATGYKNWQLYFHTSNDPASATQVTTASSNIQMADGDPADGATCDAEQMPQAETFINGYYCESDDTEKLTLSDGQNTEFQFCIQLAAGASGTYYLFLRYNDDALDDYTDVPMITVAAGGESSGSGPNIFWDL